MNRHAHDRNFIPIPDNPESSMIDMAALPIEVQRALHVCREHEAQGAVYPALLTDEVRAWFRYQDRLNRQLLELAKAKGVPMIYTLDHHEDLA